MHKKGFILGFLSYTMWGFFPLYWKFLSDRPPIETLAHRMIWSFVFYFLIGIFALGTMRKVYIQTRRDWFLSALSTLFLAINWGVYIYAVNTGHVLEGSLAYFICPIINVAVGVAFFDEAFPLNLKLAVGAAALGVATKVALAPVFPWISLVLAFSFSLYGVTKKLLKIPVIHSSIIEGTIGFVPAVFILLMNPGLDAAPKPTMNHWFLFIAGGVITGLPLFLFSFAAQHIAYSMLGILQFIAPTLQFLCGVLIFNESFTPKDLLSFGLIWLGMLFYLIQQGCRLSNRKHG